VSRVRGRVFDPFGIVIPGVSIKLVDNQDTSLQTTSDARGYFRLAARPGEYSFKATFQPFQTSQAELDVGEDLVSLVRRSDLKVILGLGGSDCAWVTTSQKEFRQIISSNEKRVKESAEKNATQK
jgi:hypothetical protein